MSYNNRGRPGGGRFNTGAPPATPGSAGQPPKRSYSMNAVPPPSSLNQPRAPFQFQRGKNVFGAADGNNAGTTSSLSKQGYSTLDSMSNFANTSQYALGRRKAKTEDEYFDDDDDQPADQQQKTPTAAYIPAPGSPSAAKDTADSDSDDPLDAFMSGIEQHLEKERKPNKSAAAAAAASAAVVAPTAAASVPPTKGVRVDIDDEDDEESYYRYMAENPTAGLPLDADGSGEELEYDEDGNPIAPQRRRDIDPLPAIDHSEISYEPFERNFYVPHDEIAALSDAQADDLRRMLGVHVTGPDPPKPVVSFAHFGFDEPLMRAIRRSDYTQPTAIQSQAIPAALSGRDLIGIAKTGSGKTVAFVWPLLVHVMDQRELRSGDGPIAVVLAPTRELALQIYAEARRFAKVYNVNVVCCYGGGTKWEQTKALAEGAEVVVATPGRMIDVVKMRATNLERCTFLVLDEADRMFNMGFEPQVRSICNHVRPDRQTLLFSATFKKRIEKLARDVLTDPVKIVQGDLGEANEDVTQHMLVFAQPAHKQNWLLAKMVEFLSVGSVLVFVTKRADAELVANVLQVREFNALLLHGEIEQADRNRVITSFKRREADILVATDVAARGLDIAHIRTVVNYDVARDIDTHTHRVGRTGRAGEKGTAYTLVLEKDKEFAGHLVRNLEGANQAVPEALMELAMQSAWFKKSRFRGGKGKATGCVGLGYKERPGLGGGAGESAAGPMAKASASSSSGGPSSNRLSALRDTFRNQYTSQFRPSTDRMWEENLDAHATKPTASTAQNSAATTSAAANPNNPFSRPSTNATGAADSDSDDETDNGPKKPVKRSRWN